MKKSLAILVFLMMLFSFSACSTAPDAAAATEPPAATAVPTAEPVATPSPTPEPTPTPEPKPGQAEYEAGMLLFEEESMEAAIASFTASYDLGYRYGSHAQVRLPAWLDEACDLIEGKQLRPVPSKGIKDCLDASTRYGTVEIVLSVYVIHEISRT